MRSLVSTARATAVVLAALLAAAVVLTATAGARPATAGARPATAGARPATARPNRLTGARPTRLAGAPTRLAGAWGGHQHTFTNRIFASGNGIKHSIPGGTEAISNPDDITQLGDHVFVGFQNGVGPQGQPSASGNTDSTIVEFSLWGREVNQWDVVGKCDGLTADPIIGQVIATVNEDANSSLYLIDPHSGATHFQYNEPLPHDGGTDAITIYHHLVLISASAPGTTGMPAPQPTYPAVYIANFDFGRHVVTVHPLFYDEDQATLANVNSPAFRTQVQLGLTDPDSNENVPGYADRFAGDFILTSQGDQEQIFVRHAGRPDQTLSVLRLTSSVDDTAWPSGRGAILTTDNSNNTINEITGPFRRGQVFVADTPCDENSAPATCPGPGFPPNFLGELDPFTGTITAVDLQGPSVEPQGMLFLRAGRFWAGRGSSGPGDR